MPDPNAPLPPIPESRAVGRRQTRLSLVWIIPIVAAIAGAWVAVTRILAEGPKITIVFRSAEGLEAGKTQIHYNGVDVGTVTTIRLSEDHLRVIITAQMAPKTQSFLVDDTKFWVVRPRISGASVTGLGTLISGAYIGMEIGQSGVSKRNFVALENPPVVTIETPGRFFSLKAPDLGSLDNGTPIYFRRLQVGQVTSYELEPDGKSLNVKVFVNAPYDQYVTPNTRFWQASGIDVSLSASGLSVQTQSLLSILVGGIAFETPAEGPVLPAADAETQFPLFPNRAEAFRLPARNPQTYLLVFKQSVRGLTVGAPVEFNGIPVGEVVAVRAQFDAKTYEFSVPVTIRVDPQSLGVKVIDMGPMDFADAHRKVIDTLVSRGLRAQLRSGSL
ncbi:MAG TPA: MlaD family protein, partial [Myxococcota bacterium]|nr:MlaD family protein [Myxococcota bacterium]